MSEIDKQLETIFLQHNASIAVIQRHESDYASDMDLYKAFQANEDKTKESIKNAIESLLPQIPPESEHARFSGEGKGMINTVVDIKAKIWGK